MNAILEMALSNALVASLMAVVVFGISRLFRRPALIHSLWLLVLIKLVTPPIVPIPIEVSWLERPAQDQVTTPVQEPLPHQSPTDQTSATTGTTRIARNEPDTAPQQLSAEETPAIDENPSWTAGEQPDVLEIPPANGVSGEPQIEIEIGSSERKEDSEESGPGSAIRTESRPAKRRSQAAAQTGTGPSALAADNRSNSEELIATRSSPSDTAAAGGWWRFPSRLSAGNAATFLAVVWIVGSVTMLFLLLLRVVWFRRVLRCAKRAPDSIQEETCRLAQQIGITRSPTVWLVPGVVSPMLWCGGRQPLLLFPRELLGRMNDKARASLLLHELAHMRRGDHFVRFLELSATCLYWWHPVVWWAKREIQIVEEECCDAWVVNHLPDDGSVYASALLDTLDFLAETRPALPPVASGIGRVEFLKRRLTLIMQGTVSGRLSGFAKLGMLAIAAVMLPLWPTLADQKEPASQIESTAAADAKPQAARDAQSTAQNPPKAKPKPISQQVSVAFDEPIDFETRSQTLQFDPLEVRCIAVSKDGKIMATGHGRWTTAGAVRVWDVKTNTELWSFKAPRGIASVKISADGSLLASSCWDRTVQIRSIKTQKVITSIESLNNVARVDFSPDGTMLATATESNALQLWKPRTGKEIGKFGGESFRMQQVAFSPDGKLIAAGGGNFSNPRNGRVAIWDVKTRKQLAVYKDHSQPVIGVAFSPDSKMLASGGFSGVVVLRKWERTPDKSSKLTLSGHRGSLECLAFSPDGKTLVSTSHDDTIRLWDVEEGDSLGVLTGHAGDVLFAAFTPDGKRLMTGSTDKTVMIWDPANQRHLETLNPGADSVEVPEAILAVAYSPDGRIVVSTHEDKTVRLRDSKTGSVLRILDG
ncbi:MAG: hypothetical protein IID45_04355, partial [Planctomycetes bacterium]|nr:hypothetical protein [Planctomycetota bacterium]